MAREKKAIPFRSEVRKIATDIREKFSAAERMDALSKMEKDETVKKHMTLSRDALKESATKAKGRIEYFVLQIIAECDTPEKFDQLMNKLVDIFPEGVTEKGEKK